MSDFRELVELEARAARLRRKMGLGAIRSVDDEGRLAVERSGFGDLLASYGRDFLSIHLPDGEYLYASPVVTGMIGWTPSELIGTSAYDWFHPEDIARIQANHAAHEDAAELSTLIEYRIRTKEGGWLWVETNSDVVMDEKGVDLIVAVTRDVSERKQMEAEKDRLFAELQARIREIEELQELIPLCSYCKSVRDDEGFWDSVEDYLEKRMGRKATHGICPDCLEELLSEAEPAPGSRRGRSV